LNRPEANELEVTLLGRGVGECVVLHLLDNVWLIIDSFVDSGARLPAAQVYLDSLGVEPEAIKTIVVTHFHTDHYRGVDRLHDYYSSARLMVTEALRADQFLALYGDDDEPPILGVLPGTIKRAYDRIIGDHTRGLRHLKIGQQVHADANVTVLALSPTDAAVLQSNREIALTMGTRSRAAVTSSLRDDNRCSVVLHVNAGGVCALLGADLVADAAAYGWAAVLDEPNHSALARADLVKVPHHGSHNAHDDVMWSNLVRRDPMLTVAPYWPSGLPTAEDIRRLARYGQVWQAAPSVSFIDDEFGNRISARPTTGIIQARRRSGERAWRIHTIPRAFRAA
jgi:Metallo-beta-lactamase superfamily